MKKELFLFLTAGFLILSGCGKTGTPVSTDAVTESTVPVETLHFEDGFQSRDQSVNFTIQIHTQIPALPFPVVEVVPHDLTGEDGARAAQALFGDAPCYEAQPVFAVKYTKREIQEKLSRWSQYTEEEAITALCGMPMHNGVDVVTHYIDEYTKRLPSAPETIRREPCQWKFQESWRYSYTREQVEQEQIPVGKDPEIRASVTADGIPYFFGVSVQNQPDQRSGMLYAGTDFGVSPIDIDERILQAELCKGKKPTPEQLHEAEDQAEQKLNQMGLGQWKVVQVQDLFSQETQEHRILVRAVPVFDCFPALYRPQLWDLKKTEEHPGIYQLSDAEFTFSPEGVLLNFRLTSPVDFVRTLEKTPAARSIWELMETAREYFSNTNVRAYGIGGILDTLQEKLDCYVSVTDLQYGLTRLREPNAEGKYTYVPSMALWGSTETRSNSTGEIYVSEENRPLLILNALDGSVIPLYSE